MTRSKHDSHFADLWARQCAERGRWGSNLAPDVPIVQPHQASKYGNVKTDGFDSARESGRAKELRLMQAAGLISELEFQPSYLLIPAQDGERACSYIADFRYRENGGTVVEDCKGMRTPAYIIKRKLMLFIHGIKVRET